MKMSFIFVLPALAFALCGTENFIPVEDTRPGSWFLRTAVADRLQKSGLPNVSYKAQMHGDEHAAGEGALGVIDLLDREENPQLRLLLTARTFA